ncbi:malto-oligosyltrehalose synthase [Dyadobacter psychrotolerans]|uniref:4-alpha-glucanotransferase n=1 Tax=Dyadobacter psychrotolerans TaxID=2541721 RepID=A0A4R5DU82_9BACT|nr:malto-oligosyltrehalose synthase [Dyadobacter psychrotolerans]TDE14483.1 malto-oligosyltrehalose synthase [Dyadobacter psychrotolerans]
MNNPIATYRLQFHKEWTFKDLESLIPYLQKLGVSTIYASPVFKSTKGSTHGYDGVNPNQIDPEIGSLDALKAVSGKLKELNMNWLQDIVPNHMAFHSENLWLMDVLEKGMQSLYVSFFDIAWNSRLYQGKLMVPFLEFDLNEVLESKKITVEYVANRFVLKNEDATYPLNPRSYLTILDSELIASNQSLAQISSQIKEIDELEEPRAFSGRWNELLLQLSSLMKNEDQKDLIVARLDEINGDDDKLKQVIDQQTYVLCNWKKTEQQINFRRFFTVNGLICLNIQNEEVFNEYHTLTKSLIEDGIVHGLRIDHIDGLYDPTCYLEKVRELAGDETYVVVEKILAGNEDLPVKWDIQGATGYEFLSWVNNLLTNKESEQTFTDFYQELTGDQTTIKQQLLKKKSHILYDHMGGELENLYQLFVELNLVGKEILDEAGKENVKKAIGEFLIHCPVYRYYGNQIPFGDEEAAALGKIFNDVEEAHPDVADAILLLKKILLEWTAEGEEEYNNKVLEFYQRCMQFTGPLMAKGGEDTLMYTNQRFIGHNDVGDSSENFGLSKADFHSKMKQRRREWPLALNTTSTHDTKRGEDVRARLNVLTDLLEEWFDRVKKWQKMNAPLREKFSAPDANDEYLIYQTLIGAYPMQGEDEDDFGSRFEEYLQKALREAKTNTTWAEPNEAYEDGTKQFARELLNKEGEFWEDFSGFHSQISEYGIVNSLSQLVLKFTCPGTPDVYQGCELWDFSLVDPDNRRPVDYEKRQQLLSETETYENKEELPEKLWEHRNDAQIKLWLTNQLFNLRKQNPVLFSEGDYIPLKVQGAFKNNVFAFARSYKQNFLVVAVPVHTASICTEQGKTLFELDWEDTKIVLPPGLNVSWESVVTGAAEEHEHKLLPGDLFRKSTVAILKGSKATNERSAGVLIHISSLSSLFAIGDMGPEAFAFADFLHEGKQRVWQLLPLNPTEEAQGNSPYSALSSRAGNSILISPEALAQEGLLEGVNLEDYYQPQAGKTDYKKAEQIKNELLRKAYDVFNAKPETFSTESFDRFSHDNKEWLEDFALYMALRKHFDDKPWTEWDDDFKLRDEAALKSFSENEKDQIRFVKWIQYVFDKQWKALRQYCNERDIKLLGDMPFYVSYNSSDVWAHRNLFMLDEDGKITGVAGVPPDAFSDDGQLWGMPVFNWEANKEEDYHWWIERLRKNIELFDFVRLDHFRAFADHWVVPGGEKTAVKGKWKIGPDAEFFKAVQTALGGLPFVAEDLGESSPAVFVLRDKFRLPGMKVLQFAFDENMPQSDYIPHNYSANFIAYTGTHDNNTIKGWYRKELDDDGRERLSKYAGINVNENDVYQIAARMIYASVARMVIMPIQDVLNLDETTKMNSPGSGDGNWEWRLVPGQLTKEAENQLSEWTVLYNRD